MDRHSGGGPPPHLRGRPVSGMEAAHANEYFEPFLNATTLKNILGYHRSMCEFLHLKPNVFTHFYPKLRANLTSWRAKAVWKKFDARASHKCYGKGKACSGSRVLVIGAGPCGLRSAIEAQLLGAKVVVIEKRDRLSRNNVLHLWPFVIEDLRMLGAKKFFGKFCAGAIDHISIRQLQCILLKVALLLGVEVHTEVSFERLLEPSSTEKTGWRAEVKPESHPVSQYEFDVIIGADGKRNTLQGFKRKEFRGKLAIAITANFINKKTEAEARVEEISGVAFIFNQKFFKDLQEETRIDLENIVYYKDDTHYFVMTAKKASLLEKGVIKQDLSDTEKLLAPENVDRDALQNYARQAADFSTNYQLPQLEFAVNHYGQPDVAMFDFTSMYAAEYASKVVERHGTRLLMILVGDSLLEPFWPTGSGCARGFLSSLDAAWAIRSYCSGQMTPLDVLAERESIYRLLAQTTPDNLNKDWKAYTLDPTTRYPNLNKSVVTPHQTVCLYDTDNPDSIDKMKRASLEAVSRQEHIPKKRRRGNVDNDVLVTWLSEQIREHEDIHITDISSAFRNGKTLCAIIHHYRPDLLDYGAIKDNEPAKCNQLAMDILEKDLGLPPFMTGDEITKTDDYLAMATYLTQVYDTFRGEIPHIKHPKLNTTKSSFKIPKSFSKLRKNSLTLTVNRLEKISEHSPGTKQSMSNTRHKSAKPSGDEAIVKKELKSEKLKRLLKDLRVCTRTEGLDSERLKVTSDDLAIIDKIRISKIPKKKPQRLSSVIETKPLKTLSEKTFLTTNISSLKSLEKRRHLSKTNVFDVTSSDTVKSKLDGVKKMKSLKRTSSTKVYEDKKLKKVKSKNVSVYVNMCESKTLNKNKLKLKKSKLSMIPENTEERLSEDTKTLSHAKDNSLASLEENGILEPNDEEKIVESTDIKIDNSDTNSNTKITRVFRCETFVQASFDVTPLPCAISSKEDTSKTSYQEGQTTGVTVNYETDRKITPRGSREKSIRNLVGINRISMLQFIRNHLLAKKQKIDLALSKPTVSNKPAVAKKVITKEPRASSRESYHSSSQSINIEIIHKSSGDVVTCQNVEYKSSRNLIKITSKAQMPHDILIEDSLRKLAVLGSGRQNIPERFTNGYNHHRKTVEQIFDNKARFLHGNNLAKTRCFSTPRLDKRKPPDLNSLNKTRRKHRTHLFRKEKPPLTPADARIIDTLGSSVIKTSNFEKTCSKTFKGDKVFTHEEKFSLQNSLRTLILKRQKLYGDLRATLVGNEDFCTESFKLNKVPRVQKKNLKMEFYDDDDSFSPQIYSRVQNWISQHDFKTDEMKKDAEGETLVTCDIPSDITSVTRAHIKKKGEYDDIKVEERTDVIKCESPISSSQEDFVELVKNLKDARNLPSKDTNIPIKPVSKYSHYNMKSVSAPPANFSVIIEGEESELPESNKRSEFSFKSIKTSNHPPSIPNNQPSRPSSRHKRHAEVMVPKPCSIDRKQRKRRTLERIGPSVIYSKWFIPLLETITVGIMLLIFDVYVNPEEYIEAPTSFLDYLWT